MINKKRVGVFAGTFDPIHNGHLAFAQAALKTGLDKVYFLVEPRPWRKQGVRALEHRRAMVDLSIKNNKKLGSIYFEKARLTPTEALPQLQQRFKGAEIVLLFGGDVVNYMIDHLAEWPQVEKLAESTSLLIAARQHDQKIIEEKLQVIRNIQGIAFLYEFLNESLPIVSSSHMRQQLKAGRIPTDMPATVVDYAQQNNLYASSGSG